MDNELEVIRDEMEETRASLASKLEALETQVRETVSGASETVTSTVEGVKDVVDTVSETVASVTETFNLAKQIEDHPWAALGIALAAGFAAGQLLGGSAPAATPAPAPQPPPQPQAPPAAASPSEPAERNGFLPSLDSLMPNLGGAMQTAISGVGALSVGTLMGVVREVAVNGLPQEWKQELSRVVDQMTTQLGGKPIQPVQKEPPPTAPSKEERLAQLEDLPSPLPPHQQNVTEPPRRADDPRSRRGRNQAGSMV